MNLLLQREDWTAFRSLGTLPQKAGVPVDRLARLAGERVQTGNEGIDLPEEPIA